MTTSYGLAREIIDAVLPDFVILRAGGGRVFDYWSATEEVCFRLGIDSGSGTGNEIDGMIVSSVEDRYGPLPDSHLTPEAARP